MYSNISFKKNVYPCSPDAEPPLLSPELLPVTLVHRNPWFKVMKRDSYYSIEYERPQVVILPILEEHFVIMVRVERPLIGDFPLELPAGDSVEGETPVKAAIREFREETGICIDDPQRFGPVLPISEMPGRMPVLLSVFEVNVNQAEFDSRLQHDHEIISVEAISFSEIAAKIVSGEIYLSSPIAIISRYLLKKYLDKSIAEKVL